MVRFKLEYYGDTFEYEADNPVVEALMNSLPDLSKFSLTVEKVKNG